MKHVQAVFKLLKDAYPGINIVRLRQRTHAVYGLYLPDGRHTTLAIAVSPRDAEHCTRNSFKEAQRLLQAAQPKEKTCVSTK